LTGTTTTAQNCYPFYSGGIYRLESATGVSFSDTGSTYERNAAYTGGVLYCVKCVSVQFVTPTFNDHMAINGGVMTLKYDTGDASPIAIDMTDYTVNGAKVDKEGGLLFFSGDSADLTLTVSGGTYQELYATET